MIRRVRRVLANPHLVRRYVRQQLAKVPYRIGSARAHLPSIIYVVINSSCNLRCRMCDIGAAAGDTHFSLNMRKGNSEIGYQDFRRFIDSVKDFKPEISIGSTEPLLYRDIIRAVRYVKEAGLSCSLGTNGMLLPRYARQLVESRLDELQIALDGPKEVHDMIRGVRLSYQNLSRGIRLVRTCRDKLKTQYPKIFINICVSEFNQDRLYETVATAVDELRADNVTVSHLNFVTADMARRQKARFPQYYATESCLSKLDLERIDAAVLDRELARIRREFDYSRVQIIPELDYNQLETFYHEPGQPVAGKDRCLVPWLAGQVSSNGDVIVLTRCFRYVLGNIHREDFKTIWNGTRATSLRKDLLKHKHFPACARCCGLL